MQETQHERSAPATSCGRDCSRPVGHGLRFVVRDLCRAPGSRRDRCLSLSTAFSDAAQRDAAQSGAALLRYKESKFIYDRQVDVHSHWIGLAMVLIVLGLCFDKVSFSEKTKFRLAAGFLAVALVFPVGVLLQVYDHGQLPKILTILGSAFAIAYLCLIAL